MTLADRRAALRRAFAAAHDVLVDAASDMLGVVRVRAELWVHCDRDQQLHRQSQIGEIVARMSLLGESELDVMRMVVEALAGETEARPMADLATVTTSATRH